jgi:hypothetical protein
MLKGLLRYSTLTLAVAVLGLTTRPAKAAGWDYDLGVYLWALGLDGTMTVRGIESDVDIGFSDIVDNLEMAFSTHFEANKIDSNWAWFFDLYWAALGNDIERPQGKFDMDMAYVEAAGAYNTGRDFQLFAGFRYITMDLELNFQPDVLPPPTPPGVPTQFKGDQSWTDLMLGGRLKKTFGERWGFWGRADLAGFGLTDGSDLTWNVVLMGQLKVARRVGLLLGYRWLDIDYENKDDLFALDVRQEGPILAVSYSFY